MERILYCDRFGRPPPGPRPLSWRDTRQLDHKRRESRGPHADWRERAEVLTDLYVEAGTRGLDEAQVHEVLGLDPGRLTDFTLSTPLLHASLAHVRRQP